MFDEVSMNGYIDKLNNANSNESMKIVEENECQYRSKLIKN